MCELAPVGEPFRKQFHLALHKLEVGLGRMPMLGDDYMAATEETPVLAERQVHIERERRVPELVSLGQPDQIVVSTDAFVELDRGRVAGVSRTRTVVARQQLRRHLPPNRACIGVRIEDGVGDAHESFSSWTAAMRACTLSIEVSGMMP